MIDVIAFLGLRRAAPACLLAVVGLAAWPAGEARAAMIEPDGETVTLVTQTGLVIGTQTAVFGLAVPLPGTFQVTLADLAWPQPLAALTVALSTPTETLAGLTAPGTFSYFVSAPGTYFASVSAAAASAFELGMYSVRVDFTPVPLPAAGWLLLTGLAVIGGVARRRRAA